MGGEKGWNIRRERVELEEREDGQREDGGIGGERKGWEEREGGLGGSRGGEGRRGWEQRARKYV